MFRTRWNPKLGFVALLTALMLALVACGGGDRDEESSSASTGGGGSAGGQIVDASDCPGDETAGIDGDTIKLGTSLPQSGLYSAFSEILGSPDGASLFIKGEHFIVGIEERLERAFKLEPLAANLLNLVVELG